jgi:hypothetical protein
MDYGSCFDLWRLARRVHAQYVHTDISRERGNSGGAGSVPMLERARRAGNTSMARRAV